MDIKGFFQRNWMYLTIIGMMLIVTAMFFKPQLDGYGVKQHDNKEAIGMGNAVKLYRESTGDEPKWSNSAFGGMPAEQIGFKKPGNWFKHISDVYFDILPQPLGLIFLHVLSFLIFARLLRLNPWVGLIGAIIFSFASYELIVIQAGHVIKSAAAAFLPALLGAFIYSFKTNRLWGVILSGVFMTLELTMNHVQITYYFFFVLLFVGIYFLIEAIKEKKIKGFLITSVGIIGVYLLAFMINSENIFLTNDYAKYSTRGGNDITIKPDGTVAKAEEGLDIKYITQWSYGIGETFTLISPYIKGGASEPIGNSPFAEKIQNSDLPQDQINKTMNGYSYWGTQPGTSGPVYIGVIAFLLAVLGLFFLKDKIKWWLFAVTILTVMLSWGKNFMGLTDFFIDYIPAYNKFRAVTMILVIAELTIPVIGVLFLNELIKERDQIIAQKKKFMMVLGGFALFLIIVRIAGLGDGYTNSAESKQYVGIDKMIMSQVMQMDPNQAMQAYQLDLSNPQQVQQFVTAQVNSQMDTFNAVKSARKEIFNSSMTRSILFAILAGGLFLIFLYMKTEKTATTILLVGLVILSFADMLPVAYNYLGGVDDASGNGFKYWEEASFSAYPLSATKGDEEILKYEVIQNPSLASKIAKGKAKGEALADELEYEGAARMNVINSYRFYELSAATNYRVLDFSGAFSSSRASFYHKSLGGYHGAKLRNIDNLISFQLSNTNSKVLDMLNVKYFLQTNQNTGLDTALVNPTALGNAWLVKDVKTYTSPNDEIRALGNKFKLKNKGPGVLLVNKLPVKSAIVYGGEKMQYLVPGRADSIPVQLSNGLPKGQEALFVIDVRGSTNLVPPITLQMDTANSFTSLVSIKVEDSFDPVNEAVMLSSVADKLTKKKFSGSGTIKLLASRPNKLTYEANVDGDQLAVFSEIYYPIGWKAFVDGKETPILKVNYLLRGLELKDGSHKIEFIYDLPKYYTFTMIARVGSILLFGLFAFGIYYMWKKKKKEVPAK